MRPARDTPLAHTMVFPDMSQPALTRTTMANEGPATGAANNGPHEVNPDPSKGNVDAPHQRAETSSILGNLERMSNNSGLRNSPGLYRVAHPLVWFPNPLAAGSGLGERRGQNALFFL